MKKYIVIFAIALFGLSFNSAYAYNGNINASALLVGSISTDLNFSWSVFGANFSNSGDTIHILFEIKDMTTGQNLVSQNVNLGTSNQDSVNLGVVYTMFGLTPGHQYKIIPHFVLYQDGIFTWFTNGTDLFFTTNCNTVNVNVAGGGVTICAGTSTNLIASGASTYEWSPSTGLSSTTGAIVIASPTSTTTYTVVGTIGGVCTGTQTAIVNVVGSINPTISSPITICLGNSTQLLAGGGTNYLWSPSTGLSSATIANPVASPTTTINYVVTISNSSCTATQSVMITVENSLNSAISNDTAICKGSSFQLLATASGATSYIWSPSINLDDPNIANPIATPTSSTTFTVTVSNGFCNEVKSTTIVVDSLPTISSVSYGGGGLNIIGSFPGLVHFIIVGNDTTKRHPTASNTIQAYFQNLTININDWIFLETVSSSCFTSFQYLASGIEEYTNMQNGELNTKIYNLLGQEIKDKILIPGIYIKGGKKIIVTEQR